MAYGLIKMSITTLFVKKMGDDVADQWDRDLLESLVGMGSNFIGWISEDPTNSSGSKIKDKAGAFGNLLDLAIGIEISLNCGKALGKSLEKFQANHGNICQRKIP